jgi:FRG domain
MLASINASGGPEKAACDSFASGQRSAQAPRDFRKLPEQFTGIVAALARRWPKSDLWFRGLDNAAHALMPGTYRRKDLYEEEEEDERRYEFRRRAVQFPIPRPSSDWEWYFLMQHQGLETRLLDWSEGALIGLYFAVRVVHGKRDAKGKRDVAVWVLDPSWLQEEVVRRGNFLPRSRDSESRRRRDFILKYMPDPDDERTKWILEYLPAGYSTSTLPMYPAPLRPPQIHRRIAAQLSAFTIHGRVHKGLEVLALQVRRPRLLKIRIPRRFVASIRADLETCGIVETTVFPELEGLGRELGNS